MPASDKTPGPGVIHSKNTAVIKDNIDDHYMDFFKHSIVKMEADIRTAQVEPDAVGRLVENKCGTQIANPLISVIDTLERRQLAVIRAMSLNQTAHDPRTINGTAKVENEARAALQDVGVAGLIAQHMN